MDGENPGQLPLALEGDCDRTQRTLEDHKEQAQGGKELHAEIFAIEQPGADGQDQNQEAIGTGGGAVAVFNESLNRQRAGNNLPVTERPGIAAALARIRRRDQHAQQHHNIRADGGHDSKYFHQTMCNHRCRSLYVYGKRNNR
jgi:hypothetical protein